MSALEDLVYRSRPAERERAGLLVLHHGRGTDENDLFGLADLLDSERRLDVVAPRAPFRFDGAPGFHWYAVPRVGYPDHDTFHASYARLAPFHDALWEATGVPPERTILGGFSMGSVMSYATGLGAGRPQPAGILAFSGFVPTTTVDGWAPELETRAGLPVLIAHGRNDEVIDVSFARRARDLLEAGGLAVVYLESEVGHQIDPAHLAAASAWIAGLTSGSPLPPSAAS
jgi:phospholipase/carboxylesterase